MKIMQPNTRSTDDEKVREEIIHLRHAIEHYTCEFELTGNNIYCWLCIGAVFQLSQREQRLSGRDTFDLLEPLTALPFFCLQYIHSVSTDLSAATRQLNHPKPPASGSQIANSLSNILGLTAPGWNAFTQYQRDQRQGRTALTYIQFRDAGLSSSAAAERVAEQSGRADERTVRRHVAAINKKRTKP